MKERLALLHQEFLIKIKKLKDIVPRSLVIPDIPQKIKVVIGMRRTGKTYYLLQKIQTLLKEGVEPSRVLYLNLEDDRLQPIDRKDFAELVDSFFALFPGNHQQKCYLFFDEIQNVSGWSLVIRRLFDSKDVDIFLTGSSAKLLSSEIATELRGRSIAYEMWPYSFSEYLQANKITFKKPRTKIDREQLKPVFLKYLEQGGFPELTHLPAVERQKTLQEYVDVVIFRDIVERHNIGNLQLVKYMIKVMTQAVASNMTLNKFYNDLKSQGYALGRATLYEYMEHIQDAYLSFSVPLYSESVRKTQVNPRKIYSIDTGLSNAYRLSINKHLGRLFENLIFLDLKRRGDEIFYYLTKERYEVNFFTRSLDGTLNLYQVAWDISEPDTHAREQRALQAAEKELGITGAIITPDNYFDNFEVISGNY